MNTTENKPVVGLANFINLFCFVPLQGYRTSWISSWIKKLFPFELKEKKEFEEYALCFVPELLKSALEEFIAINNGITNEVFRVAHYISIQYMENMNDHNGGKRYRPLHVEVQKRQLATLFCNPDFMADERCMLDVIFNLWSSCPHIDFHAAPWPGPTAYLDRKDYNLVSSGFGLRHIPVFEKLTDRCDSWDPEFVESHSMDSWMMGIMFFLEILSKEHPKETLDWRLKILKRAAKQDRKKMGMVGDVHATVYNFFRTEEDIQALQELLSDADTDISKTAQEALKQATKSQAS